MNIRIGIGFNSPDSTTEALSDLVEHAADVWVLDPLPFGDAAKGTIVSATNAITNRHAQDTA
jgi:hypothetical protein